MIFIGIAIFTVYTMQTVYVGACEPRFSTNVICADIARQVHSEIGEKLPVYVGEFGSIESCQKGTGAEKYQPKAVERVDALVEVICVPNGAP
ncbi:MAG: hypothetical protein M3O26_10600 [Pseudomonadota bacterium]|nr:hypothetical protein [Pseudomonadota bacterium]